MALKSTPTMPAVSLSGFFLFSVDRATLEMPSECIENQAR